MTQRRYTLLDQFIMQVDDGLSTLFTDLHSTRTNPADQVEEKKLSSKEKQESIGCMRVNHTGEVCAQALYRGHMLVASSNEVHKLLHNAAVEETDHLAWCHERLKELGGHRSYLNPVWYGNSLLIGVVAGIAGDEWSLGFVEETEKQVEAHLDKHLHQLPKNDVKSHKIVEQMKADEIKHGQSASKAGAKELPFFVKKVMGLHAKVMTTVAYWV